MLKPYDSYKETGVQWVKGVPSHWDMLRIGSIFNERKQKVSDKEFEPLSVTKNGIMSQLENAAKSNDGDNRKLVCIGDFVINSRSDRKGSSGISNLTGSVSLINIVLEPQKKQVKKFCHYLLKSNLFIEEYYKNGRGIVADLWTTRYSEMKTVLLPIPNIKEQQQIADYLDWQISNINRLINAKKKQIELLKEQRQAIINKAVTKGLDDNVTMKNSGVEWLGEVPESWEIKRFKQCFYTSSGHSVTKAELSDNGTNCIGYGDIHSKYKFELDLETCMLRKLPYDYERNFSNCFVKENDFIFCDTSEDIEGSGNCTYIKNLNDECLVAGSHTIIARPICELNSRFIAYLFRSTGWRLQIQTDVSGVKVYSITQKILRKSSIILPIIQEQLEIVNYLDNKCNEIDKAIDKVNKEIILLNEYKTSLISSVVTGKVDVREIVVPDFEVEEVVEDYVIDELEEMEE